MLPLKKTTNKLSNILKKTKQEEPLMIKVLIVDDSMFMRKMIADILEEDHRIKVIATAKNGFEALDKIQQLKPDVVTLDLEMPKISGLDTLYEIMRTNPTPTVIISAYSPMGSKEAILALQYGAIDIVEKPSGPISMNISTIKEQILAAVKAAANANPQQVHKFIKKKIARKIKVKKEIILIAASSGGPPAIESILKTFPKRFPIPIVILQHMPRHFTKAFAERLNRVCHIAVKEAEDNEKLCNGQVYIAPGGKDLTFEKKVTSVRIRLTEAKQQLTPNIDTTFNSAAQIYREKVLAIILTGMGSDGAQGALQLKNKGAQILAQDKKTSTVFGMPQAVVALNAADEVVSLPNMPETMNKYL